MFETSQDSQDIGNILRCFRLKSREVESKLCDMGGSLAQITGNKSVKYVGRRRPCTRHGRRESFLDSSQELDGRGFGEQSSQQVIWTTGTEAEWVIYICRIRAANYPRASFGPMQNYGTGGTVVLDVHV